MSGHIKAYDAVAFDLDGTLLNTQRGIINAVRAAVTELGFTMPNDEVLRGFIGPPMVKSMGETFGLDRAAADNATEIFRKYYAEQYLMQAEPYEGLFALLDMLKNSGVKIGVATYKRTDYGRKILQGFGIADYCASICGDTNESSKTKADIVRDCIKELGADPSRTLYIGDTRGDFIGAEEAGADFAAVTYGFGFVPGHAVEPCLTLANQLKSPVLVANTVQDVIQYLFKENTSGGAKAMYDFIVGYDKNGAPLAKKLEEVLEAKGISFRDMGVEDDTYYPIVAERVCKSLLAAQKPTRAILVCGTGIGMSIAANKLRGIYAAVCHDAYSAERAVLSNNANVFCFGAQVIGDKAAAKHLEIILPLEFKEGRSTPKLAEIKRIEQENL